MTNCKNCGEKVHVPDDRTGLIHEHGKYACYDENDRRMETVAE